MKRLAAVATTTTLLLCGLSAASPALAQDAAPSTPAFYDAKIKPVFAANCYKCHTDKMSGGLRLDSRESMLKGGDSGAAIVVGAPEKSLLVTAVHQTDPELKMPPKGPKLSDAEIADIEAWIKAGAVWSASAPGSGMAAVGTTANTSVSGAGQIEAPAH